MSKEPEDKAVIDHELKGKMAIPVLGGLTADQIKDLRDQIRLARQDPDFAIVTNFPVEWVSLAGV